MFAVLEEVQYAQLLLMFEAQLPNSSGHLEWQQLVYLKWFRKVASKGDAVMALMMPKGRASQQDKLQPVLLEEEIVHDAAANRRQCRCSVMPLSALIRRTYIGAITSSKASFMSAHTSIEPLELAVAIIKALCYSSLQCGYAYGPKNRWDMLHV
jgi:hypothetical protein